MLERGGVPKRAAKVQLVLNSGFVNRRNEVRVLVVALGFSTSCAAALILRKDGARATGPDQALLG
jgi:hypothetical protein